MLGYPDSAAEPWPPYTAEDVDSVCDITGAEKRLVEASFRVLSSHGGRPRIDEVTEALLCGVHAESILQREVSRHSL